MPTLKSVAPWYLYVIETKYKHLYTGITTDWQRRFNEHKDSSAKTAKALKGKGPLVIKLCIKLKDRRSAMQAEIWLKKQNKSRKLAIINNTSELPFEHSLVALN